MPEVTTVLWKTVQMSSKELDEDNEQGRYGEDEKVEELKIRKGKAAFQLTKMVQQINRHDLNEDRDDMQHIT